MAKIKNKAILIFKQNEVSPNASTSDLFLRLNNGGHFGKLKAYNPKNKDAADVHKLVCRCFKRNKLTHKATIKPTVPHTLIGG
jgi:hypothetical protein